MNKAVNNLLFGNDKKEGVTKEYVDNRSKKQIFIDALKTSVMNLIKLNLILLVPLLPLIVWTIININLLQNATQTNLLIYALGLFPCLLILTPALSGGAYIVRKMVREEHIFLWHDFWSKTKSNYKQSLIYGAILGGFIIFISLVSMSYGAMLSQNDSNVFIVLNTIFKVIAVFFFLTSVYVFPMIVTYDLKMKYIIKNSILLEIISLLKLILFLIMSAVPIIVVILIQAMFPLIGYILLFLYSVFLGVTLPMFIMMFYINEAFKKYLGDGEQQEEKVQEEN